MNPPYQSNSGNKGAGNTLWDKFVKVANELVIDNGLIAAVHPSLWRKPCHPLREEMIDNNTLEYLEIHDERHGTKTFGSETRYDWYISRKGKKHGKTLVVGQNGEKAEIDLRSIPFIPNCDFELVNKLVAKKGEPTVEIINDRSAYGADKDWLNDEENPKFKHPCVYMVGKNEFLSLKWSSRNDKGHFGIPKVIYSSGRPISVGFFIDKDGAYGMTQWASGIVDKLDNLEKIAEALRSDKFRKFCSSISMSKLEINTSVLRTFRKDFWKEFI
jgi:hypothetical protein